ncbi:MAG: tRNA uridine-5-carboxymethylaminomethyl(34) synthesis enzyme MnmG [Sphaerochaetaceae bacterium]|jgi:tRNA uridine 5-carboxymethylaminomethyl modification enzyme
MDYDAIVIGAGHAGIEASLALSRLGYKTLVITQNIDAIGHLPCNPAIGGLAKGNLVREIDALGGQMGKLIDVSMIQFRLLNRRRGPAVQSPRAQADKFTYQRLAKECLEGQQNLALFQDTVIDLLVNKQEDEIVGVVTQRGHQISAQVVVLTTGTFMEAKIMIGQWEHPSGRLGEAAAIGLGSALRAKGFVLGRMKTDTSPRVHKDSLDLQQLEEQQSEEPMLPFSFDHVSVKRPALSCYISWTNEKTHHIIAENLSRSASYGGKLASKGPRYCPSIEDKVFRFPDRKRHQVFIEPEGMGTKEMYLNGISTSLPEEIQVEMIRSIKGLEKAHIMRPGYAVEYDYLDPTQLLSTLETKRFKGLFVAGQTNGTSGYEEAASQGLLAGINAALHLSKSPPLRLSRSEAYIGVLVDDLVTKGTKEPYRMFSSRAEYRLSMRHDTADRRLSPLAFELGLQSSEALERLQKKIERIEELKELLKKNSYEGKNALEALRNPHLTIEELDASIPSLASFEPHIRSEVSIEIKYEGYVKRQERQIERFDKMEKMGIPKDFDYMGIEGLSSESKQLLLSIRPSSVGQAKRISGIRPSDIAILLITLAKKGRKHEQ